MRRPKVLWPPVLDAASPSLLLELEDGRRVALSSERAHAEDCRLGEDCTCGASEEGLRDVVDAGEALGYRLRSRLVCAACGGQTVQAMAWLDLNTGEVLGERPLELLWCPACGSAAETREVPL